MSARSISKASLDARFSKLRAQMQNGGEGSGGSIVPLSRYKFISGDSAVAGETGSIAEPYDDIAAFITSISPTGTSVADNATMIVGKITPAQAGYTENVTIPAYRSVELRADDFNQVVTGGVTWHNTAAAGGANAPTVSLLSFHNLSFSGGLVVTDDAVNSEIFVNGDEVLASGFTGLVDLSGATHVLAFLLQNTTLAAGFLSTVGASGAELVVLNGEVVGPITAKILATENATISSSAITLGTSVQAGFFQSTSFGVGSSPVITGGVASGLTFDGPSWRSFKEAGGTYVNSFVLVVGGFRAGDVPGAALPATGAVSVSLNGTGATAGYTAANSGNSYAASGQTGDVTVTVKTGGGELPGDTMHIVKSDLAAHNLIVHNNGGTQMGTIPSGSRGDIVLKFVGPDWAFDGGGSLAA